jgi:sulfite exporter TauE/SafE
VTGLWWIAVAGAAGSFHCLGMCSGFALSLAPSAGSRWKTAGRHLVYALGRLTSYSFLGVAAGVAGRLAGPSGPLGIAQRGLALVSGALMVLMALQLFGLRAPLHFASAPGLATLMRGIHGLLRAPGVSAPLAFGIFNGLLPCPLVYAFVAQAVGSGSAPKGLLTMVAFGSGTVPAMLFVGLAGTTLSPAWRVRGVRIAASVILLFGLVTLARGTLPAGFLASHVMPGMAGHAMAGE